MIAGHRRLAIQPVLLMYIGKSNLDIEAYQTKINTTFTEESFKTFS